MAIEHNGQVLFSDDELACRLTGEYRLAPGVAENLKRLRLQWDRPMVLTSAARSKRHNKNVGGHRRSLHVYDDPFWPTAGCAAFDVAITDAVERAEFAKLALSLGWSLGFHSKFIHIDRRIDYTPRKQAIFLY